MAFEGLSEKLSATFKRLRGKGRLTEADVREGMREVRLALLEADVSYKVVKDFVAQVTERCIGADVLDSLTPAQQIVKIVNEELVQLMGGTNAKLTFASKGPTVVMMVGLQGAGKTTNGAKLAGLMRRQFGKRPLLAACDVYRPAAIKQLQVAQRSPKVRAQSLLGLGRAFFRGGKYDLAVEQLLTAKNEAKIMNESKKEIIYELASVYEKMGKPDLAFAEYKEIYTVDASYKDVSAKVDYYYSNKK